MLELGWLAGCVQYGADEVLVPVETGDRLNYGYLLSLSKFWIHGQSQNLSAGRFRIGELAHRIAKIRERRLQVQWERVINLRWNSGDAKVFAKSVALFAANRELIVNVPRRA